MGYGIPKCFHFLCRDHGFSTSANGRGDDDRKGETVFFEDILAGDQGSFGVERVEDGFHHEDVDTTFHECADLAFVVLVDLVENNGAKTRIIGVDCGVVEADGHRADRSGNVTFDAGGFSDFITGGAGQFS